MNYSLITVRYAKALFSLAKEKNILDQIKTDVDLGTKIINENPELLRYLSFPVIKPSLKINTINKIFAENVNPVFKEFVTLVINNKREAHLLDIFRSFERIYKADQNIKTTRLTTALPIDKNERKAIVNSIESRFNSKVELHETVDPEIIGGVIIEIDDAQLDLSVIKKLQRIRTELSRIDLKTK